jgi:hypothetical protein
MIETRMHHKTGKDRQDRQAKRVEGDRGVLKAHRREFEAFFAGELERDVPEFVMHAG